MSQGTASPIQGLSDKHVGRKSEEVKHKYPKRDGVKRYYGSGLVHKVYDDMVALNTQNNAVAWRANEGTIKNQSIKKVEESLKMYKDLISSACNVNYTIEEKGRKKIIKIQPVEALPPMTYWTGTPVNIPTPDSKYLSHVPFMGDEHGKRKTETDFSDELLERYDWKLHAENEFDWLVSSDIVSILDFIRVLMEVDTKFGDAFPDNYTDARCAEKPSAEELREIYDSVLKADEKSYLSRKPSTNLVATICAVKFPEVKPADLLKCYNRLSERRNAEFNKLKCPPENVDDPDNVEVYSKEVQMDSYGTMFCRICFKYACPEHTLMMSKEEISTMQSVVKLQRQKSSTAKKSTAKMEQNGNCEFKDCCKHVFSDNISSLPAHKVQESWRKILSKWTSTERTMFNCHYEALEDYCIVASLINTKTCREVMMYHTFSQLMSSKEFVTNCDGKATTDSSLSSPEIEVASSLGSSGYESTSPNSTTATLNMTQEEQGLHELCSFIPCCHSSGVCDEQCICVAGKKFCEASCGCLKSCKNRSKGCLCLTTCDTKRCPCYIANRECDPDLCKKCGSHEVDIEKVKCKNVAVQRRLKKPIYIAKSKVVGLGAFAGVDIRKGEFIDEYTAEMISSIEADRRGYVYDERQHTFLFDLSDNLVLDASRLGNKCRFINSSKRPNCEPVKMVVRGEQRLAIRAIKDIRKDDELFFNYHEILVRDKTSKDTRKRTKKYVSA